MTTEKAKSGIIRPFLLSEFHGILALDQHLSVIIAKSSNGNTFRQSLFKKNPREYQKNEEQAVFIHFKGLLYPRARLHKPIAR